MPLVGLAEIVGGLPILFPKTRAIGAVIIIPFMVGILCTNILVASEAMGIGISLVFSLFLLWIIVENKHKYLPMLSK